MQPTPETLAQAIALIHAGEKDPARSILLAMLKTDPNNQVAWLWLAEAADTDAQRISVLEQCLKRIPNSQVAQEGLKRLRAAKGLPEAAVPPAPATPAPTAPAPRSPLDIPTRPTSKPKPSQAPILAAYNGTDEKPLKRQRSSPKLIPRLLRYTTTRLVTLAIMVTISVFLTIVVANLGGFLDKVKAANIDEGIGMMIKGGWLKDVTDEEERFLIIEQTRAAMQEGAGLNSPFLVRCFRWLWDGLTLDWGKGWGYTIYGGDIVPEVRDVILDYLPRTLMVFGSANILLFFTSIFIALGLSRKYGSWQDRLVTALAPLAAAPSWVYGLIIAGFTLHVMKTYTLPFDRWPPGFQWSYLGFYLKNMLPAIAAIFISKFFQSVYTWRTVFLVNSSEDYVDVAKAKGLPDGLIERRYILRPLLPNILTNFALIMIALWQEAIILETIFSIAGIGRLFRSAIQAFDVRMIVALVVTFAYILAITVFLLDIVYALVDPRVSLGHENQSLKVATWRKRFLRGWFQGRKRVKAFPAPRRSRITVPKPVYGAQANKPIVLQRHPKNRQVSYAPHRFHTFSLRWKTRWKNTFGILARYPSAAVGLGIIFLLFAVSIYTIIAYPYKETTKAWRGDNFVWMDNPVYAQPVWVNWFRKDDLPKTIILKSSDPSTSKTVTRVSADMQQIDFSLPFEYNSLTFPQEIILTFEASYREKKPLVSLIWITPDGRELDLGNTSVTDRQSNYLFLDEKIQRKLKNQFVDQALFGDPRAQEPVALQGLYQLKVSAFVFEDDADVDIKFALYGKVWGVAGTDAKRRDTKVGLLWGTPIALSFGLLAAVFTTITTLIISATGVWFGGWVDGLIQRFTEINMILPLFPAILMVYTLYSKSFWVLLGVTVLLSIFGSAIKNYRSLFIQIKEMPYLEVARLYGASDWRIIFSYFIPRIGAIIVPQLVIMVPSYVFLEAGLAVLGLYDPNTPPTWGQLVMDGLQNGVQQGAFHLVLEPAFLLLLTGYAFLLLGISLERVFEPRLRER